MKLSIALFATSKYLHVWKYHVRRMLSAAAHIPSAHLVYVSNLDKKCLEAAKFLKKECPNAWQIEHIALDVCDDGEKYKQDSQLAIARLQGEAFAACRRAQADFVWTVESDVLVPPESLRMMEWALRMPQEDGTPYYDIAMCTYPNGMFLGGHGDYQHPIAENFLPEEKKMSAELRKRYEKLKMDEKGFSRDNISPGEEWRKQFLDLHEEIKKCEPIGNIWEINAKHGWRRRGWMDFAYPGIGRGAIVPTDWVGLGCNLLSKRALALATFDGYDGKGTQDLFLCWRRWHPAGLRMTTITHAVCDHVKVEGDKIVHYHAFHEPAGEARGHLRVMKKDWIET